MIVFCFCEQLFEDFLSNMLSTVSVISECTQNDAALTDCLTLVSEDHATDGPFGS